MSSAPRRATALALAVSLISLPASAQLQPDSDERPAPMQPNELGDYLPDPKQEVPLSEDELMRAFNGMTHLGSYNFNRPNIDTTAFSETTSEDGRTRHTHGDKVDVGTWRIRDNVICFEYEEWEESESHRACFNIFQRGNCYYHYALQFRGFGVGGRFTARSVHAGEVPDCEPAFA